MLVVYNLWFIRNQARTLFVCDEILCVLWWLKCCFLYKTPLFFFHPFNTLSKPYFPRVHWSMFSFFVPSYQLPVPSFQALLIIIYLLQLLPLSICRVLPRKILFFVHILVWWQSLSTILRLLHTLALIACHCAVPPDCTSSSVFQLLTLSFHWLL